VELATLTDPALVDRAVAAFWTYANNPAELSSKASSNASIEKRYEEQLTNGLTDRTAMLHQKAVINSQIINRSQPTVSVAPATAISTRLRGDRLRSSAPAGLTHQLQHVGVRPVLGNLISPCTKNVRPGEVDGFAGNQVGNAWHAASARSRAINRPHT
jgi:hypothetical protein